MIETAPSTAYEAQLEAGTTGLVGTVAFAVYDGDTVITALATTSINEIGATGVYVATRTAPGTAGQYTILWSLDGTLDPDQVITDELVVAGFAGDFESPTGDSYIDTDELFRILKIRTPTDEQTVAAQRVLITAAGEINAEIDRGEDDPALSGWQLSLAAEVNLERAVEHWNAPGNPWGLVGTGEMGATFSARDSWERHALKLAPLKTQWGVA